MVGNLISRAYVNYLKNIISIAKLTVFRVCKLVQGRIKTRFAKD